MDISPVTTASTTTTPANTAKPVVATSDFETFLTLLTTQLRNQDPLKPLESTEFVAQLASFSAVEQQVRTNDALGRIEAALGGSSASGLAAWIGMEVKTTQAVNFEGQPVTLVTDIARSADRAELVVRDRTGAAIQRLAVPTESTSIEWAGVTDDGGPLPAGEYAISVESYRGEALLASNPVATYGRVTEARLDGAETTLVLADSSEVPASGVMALREPGGS
ncbi:MAG: hypothetical protein KDK00_15410 [Rhodobacteraceae bacterium]|nr:hypothetical protein [Paracoccaceae bacterium]